MQDSQLLLANGLRALMLQQQTPVSQQRQVDGLQQLQRHRLLKLQQQTQDSLRRRADGLLQLILLSQVFLQVGLRLLRLQRYHLAGHQLLLFSNNSQ